jgi:hypothetical protein
MPMWTIVAGTMAIAVTDASEEAANALLDDPDLRDDLTMLRSGGVQLWDGLQPLVLRAATQDEIAEFDDTFAADEEPDEDDDGGASLVFLLDLDESH